MADLEQLKSLSANSDISDDDQMNSNSSESETERNEDTPRQDPKYLSDGSDNHSEGNGNKQNENSKTVPLNTKITDDDATDEHEQLTSSQYDSNVNGSETEPEINRQDFTESHSDHHKSSENTSPQVDKRISTEINSKIQQGPKCLSDGSDPHSEGNGNKQNENSKTVPLDAYNNTKITDDDATDEYEQLTPSQYDSNVNGSETVPDDKRISTEINSKIQQTKIYDMPLEGPGDQSFNIHPLKNTTHRELSNPNLFPWRFTGNYIYQFPPYPLDEPVRIHRLPYPIDDLNSFRNQFPPYPVEVPPYPIDDLNSFRNQFAPYRPPYPINKLDMYQMQQIPKNDGSIYHQQIPAQHYASTYQIPNQQCMPNHRYVPLTPSVHSPLQDAKYCHQHHHESHPTNSNQIPNGQNSNNGSQARYYHKTASLNQGYEMLDDPPMIPPYQPGVQIKQNTERVRQYQNYHESHPAIPNRDPNRQYSNNGPQSMPYYKGQFNDPNHRQTAALTVHSSSGQALDYNVVDDPPMTPQFQMIQEPIQNIAESKQILSTNQIDQEFYQPGVQVKQSSEESNKEQMNMNDSSPPVTIEDTTADINQTLSKNVEKPTPEKKIKHPSNPSCEDASFQDTSEPCSEKNDTPKQKLSSNSKDCEKKYRNVLVEILDKDSHLTKEKLEMSLRKKIKEVTLSKWNLIPRIIQF